MSLNSFLEGSYKDRSENQNVSIPEHLDSNMIIHFLKENEISAEFRVVSGGEKLMGYKILEVRSLNFPSKDRLGFF